MTHKIYILALLFGLMAPPCVAILTIAFYHRRKHPCFVDVLNFKRPFWLVLFISIGMIALGFAGVAVINTCFFDYGDRFLLIGLPFFLLILAGVFLCIVSSIRCLWYLIPAIVSYLKAKQNDN